MPISINDLSETALHRLHASLSAWNSWGADSPHSLQQDAALVGRKISRRQAMHLAKLLRRDWCGRDLADVPLKAFVKLLDEVADAERLRAIEARSPRVNWSGDPEWAEGIAAAMRRP